MSRFLLLAVVGSLIAGASIRTSTPTAAEVLCESYPYSANGYTRWTRVCWHAPQPQRANSSGAQGCQHPRTPCGGSRADDWRDAATFPAPQKKPASALPSSPQIPQEPLAIFIVAAVGVIMSRLILRAKERWQERRLNRIEQKALSAQALTDRLHQDASEADRLIQAYVREAYRRGGDF